MESLYDLILRLKQETSSITLNPVLDAINLDKIRGFEHLSLTEPHYKRKLKIIRENLKNVDYIFSEKYKVAFGAYNELVVYEQLNEKITTEIIKEKKQPTPDYKLSLNDSDHRYSDLKTLHYFNGSINYTEIQEESAKSKIKHEKEIKKKQQPITFSDPVSLSPFKKGNNPDYQNLSTIIEDLIDKSSSIIKLDQINFMGQYGIALIDTVNLYLHCDLKLGLPVHDGYLYKELNSGILWNVAFGEIGDPTYNWIECEGLPNIGKRLTKQGILKDDQFRELRAIAYIVHSSTDRKIIGFHRAREKDTILLDILYKICDFVNDEYNSQYWRLGSNPV